jgi:hypothetical protein
MPLGTVRIAAAAAILSAIGLSGAWSTAAPSAAAPGRQCFNANSIHGYETLPGGLVLMRAGGNRTFALHTFGDCPDLNWSRSIALRTRGGSSWICEGIDAELIVPSPIGAQYCPVQAVRRISREEARALRLARRR